ncbi:MAG: response regulator [Candidatus Omnitrophica bacterium]|nr:response regulator [Candidatus Omnitrophota bacterium]
MNKKILIIDDEKVTRTLLSKLLSDAGYEIVCEDEGIAGLETAKSVRPDLIILDVAMPGFNGYHICDELKSNEKFKNIPIILLTSRSDDVDRMIADEVKADLFMAKPFDTNNLLHNVRRFIN